MESAEERLLAALRTNGVDDGLSFLMVELYELIGEAMTNLFLLQREECSPSDINPTISRTIPVLRNALNHVSLLDAVREFLKDHPPGDAPDGNE